MAINTKLAGNEYHLLASIIAPITDTFVMHYSKTDPYALNDRIFDVIILVDVTYAS